MIDNTLSYFTEVFIPKIAKLNEEELHRHNFDVDFLSLFPEEMLASGEEYHGTTRRLYSTTPPTVPGFD